MREFVQTNLDPGNCWQTALACILDVEPSTLPDQTRYDFGKNAGKGWASSYSNVLQGYLGKHFDLIYCELQAWQFGGLSVRPPGWHLLIGPTVRTPVNNSNHCVVGRYGREAWDVHPSRAGLLSIHSWGVLSPLPTELRLQREKHTDPDYRRVFLECLCPFCEAERGDQDPTLPAD